VCGRYTLTDPGRLRERFQLGEEIDIRPRYNVAPGDLVPAAILGREGERHGALLRWGLVPSWAADERIGARLINARAETAAHRPAFRTALARLRCLIPADGFYEWTAPGRGPRQAYWITRADREPFAFAGVWSTWRAPNGAERPPLRSFAILTRPANEAIAPLHDRMPVILSPAQESAWLDPMTPAGELTELAGCLRSLSAEQTLLSAVGEAVGDPRHDSPDCLAPPAGVQDSLF
jgi:putative SOS response-associated peptidase YedK